MPVFGYRILGVGYKSIFESVPYSITVNQLIKIACTKNTGLQKSLAFFKHSFLPPHRKSKKRTIILSMTGQSFITVKVKTKPYVKHFLHQNYGTPVVLESGSFISKYMVHLLSKPSKVDNHKCKTYTTEVDIILNEDKFKRFGFALTKTNTKEFNVGIENYIRTLIRQITDNILQNTYKLEDWQRHYQDLNKEHKALLKLHAGNLTSSSVKKLRKFETIMNERIEEADQHRIKIIDALQMAAYDCLGFDEQILPLETIKKDYYRYKKRCKA